MNFKGFRISPQQLQAAITPKTKVLILNSPSNPAGHAYTPEEMKALADVVAKHPNLIVFSDEIYEKLVYGGLKFVSFAALDPRLVDQTLTFNCHSKSFAMTGWRVGYIGGPKPVIDACNKLNSQMCSHITSFTQMPAALALNDPRGAESIETMRREFEQRGRHMWERLNALPQVTCIQPQGAFYCFPNVSAYLGKSAGDVKLSDAVAFAAALLEQGHVAVVPGNDSGFDTHVRLSFATSMKNIDAGIDRIAAFLQSGSMTFFRQGETGSKQFVARHACDRCSVQDVQRIDPSIGELAQRIDDRSWPQPGDVSCGYVESNSLTNVPGPVAMLSTAATGVPRSGSAAAGPKTRRARPRRFVISNKSTHVALIQRGPRSLCRATRYIRQDLATLSFT